jgi:hypothetical protein
MIMNGPRSDPQQMKFKWLSQYSVYQKSIAFQIQLTIIISDLIVLNCFELMIRDENISYLQKRSIKMI